MFSVLEGNVKRNKDNKAVPFELEKVLKVLKALKVEKLEELESNCVNSNKRKGAEV